MYFCYTCLACSFVTILLATMVSTLKNFATFLVTRKILATPNISCLLATITGLVSYSYITGLTLAWMANFIAFVRLANKKLSTFLFAGLFGIDQFTTNLLDV